MSKGHPDISPDLLNELDRKLQEMALVNFELFCKLAGVDKKQAFVCFEIKKGKSYGKIGIQMKIGKSTVRAIAKKCAEKLPI